MRYLIDPEYRPARVGATRQPSAIHAAELRRELSARNLKWASDQALCHEVTLGSVPAVLYREDSAGQHGNYLAESYARICASPPWARRLRKVHTSSKRALLSRDPDRRELDSSNSSDALLMNIFCHPETLASTRVRRLLGVDDAAQPVFGHKPRVPLLNGRKDATEVDMKLGDLLVEAKLTEYDFQRAPLALVQRYASFEEVFDAGRLPIELGQIHSYQLIRSILAAHAYPEYRFCLLCDARRPDLISRWNQVLTAVEIYDLRHRLMLLTWQELAAALPFELQHFLGEKYGIFPA